MNKPISSDVQADVNASSVSRKRKEDNAYVRCFLQLLFQHLRAFRASHLLVLLTMSVGAMAMSATFFIGDGAMDRLWQDMEQLMGSQIIIRPDQGPNAVLLTRRASVSFTAEDLEALRANVTTARTIVPHQLRQTKISANGIETIIMVDGVSPELKGEKTFAPLSGRTFSGEAENGLACECLATAALTNALGVTEGARVNIDGRHFLVVGVIPDPPTSDSRAQKRVAIPMAIAHLMYGRPGLYDAFAATWKSPRDLETMIDQIRRTLDQRLGPGCYFVSSSRLAAQKKKKVVANVMILATAQAFFCVLVASIGVANVMLANVVRRRREYAIRIAVGARQADIFGLVLCESTLIGLLGGVVGVLVAMTVSPFICQAMAGRIQSVSLLNPVFCLRGILIAVFSCAGSGLLAGIFPAWQVRRIDVLSSLYTE